MAAQGSLCLPPAGCPNEECSCYGSLNGNIVRAGSDARGPRFRCTACGHTFSPFSNPLVDHLREPTEARLLDVTLDYLHGHTVRAIACNYDLSAATVQRLLSRASDHPDRFTALLASQRPVAPERLECYDRALRWRQNRRGRMTRAQRLRLLQPLRAD
jgi:transposase-like protein